MNDPICCSGGYQVASISFGINRPSEAYHRHGSLCTHKIWIGNHLVYNGEVYPSWSQPDADVLGDILDLKRLIRDNPNMTYEDLMRGNYTEGE